MENLGYFLQEEEVSQSTTRHAERNCRNTVRIESISRSYLIAKRLLDIVASIVAIVIAFIPMMVISLLIFLQDFKTPFFKQERVTKNGVHFMMYKFRTMHMDAEKHLKELQRQNEADGPVFKMEHDPRVTKIGRILRKTSLDELPQFFNVLFGSMSLVGPRPPLPSEVAQYTPYQMQRLDVKGGITCYWQCSGRSNIPFEHWVELDLKYIRECSVWVDIKILLRTVVAVLRRDGAA